MYVSRFYVRRDVVSRSRAVLHLLKKGVCEFGVGGHRPPLGFEKGEAPTQVEEIRLFVLSSHCRFCVINSGCPPSLPRDETDRKRQGNCPTHRFCSHLYMCEQCLCAGASPFVDVSRPSKESRGSCWQSSFPQECVTYRLWDLSGTAS